MARIPTEEKVKAWAEKAKAQYLAFLSQKNVEEKVLELLNYKTLLEVIYNAAGLKSDGWGKLVLQDSSRDDEVIGYIRSKAESAVSDVLKDLDLTVKPKEAKSIRSVYRSAYIRQLKKLAEEEGAKRAEGKIAAVLRNTKTVRGG